jgi:hypothetical protein
VRIPKEKKYAMPNVNFLSGTRIRILVRKSRTWAGNAVDFRHQSPNGIERRAWPLEAIMPPDLANQFNPSACKAALHLLDDTSHR